MLQHPATDFYDLSASTLSNRQTPPQYSPQGGGAVNNNNNSSDNGLDLIGQNGNNNNDREFPSFGFTQEQVACVCEVSLKLGILNAC